MSVLEMKTYLPVKSSEASIQFYVHELGYFEVRQEWGMGQWGLGLIGRPGQLFIFEHDGVFSDQPRIEFVVDDLQSEFERLSRMQWSSGGRCVSPEIFEYPAGKNFELRDPSGYCVLLSNDAAQNPAPASKRERPDQDLSSLAELVGGSTKKAGD